MNRKFDSVVSYRVSGLLLFSIFRFIIAEALKSTTRVPNNDSFTISRV
jgi:hypothetical protein